MAAVREGAEESVPKPVAVRNVWGEAGNGGITAGCPRPEEPSPSARRRRSVGPSTKDINTPISRSRHFEIESEAPVGRNPEVLPLITGAAMSYCCVPGCTSYQRKECDKELSFHRFPMSFFSIFFFFF